MTNEEAAELARQANLVAATRLYMDSLKALGVESYLIGYALSQDPEGQGVTSMAGSATLILNLIASIVKAMRPEDFRNLFVAMLKSDYFASHRGETIKPVDPKKVN